VEVFELGAGTFQVSAVIEEMQTAEKLLGIVTNESNNLVGTEKAVPVDKPDDLVVAIRQCNRWNR
jgi:hypothetical protein